VLSRMSVRRRSTFHGISSFLAATPWYARQHRCVSRNERDTHRLLGQWRGGSDNWGRNRLRRDSWGGSRNLREVVLGRTCAVFLLCFSGYAVEKRSMGVQVRQAGR